LKIILEISSISQQDLPAAGEKSRRRLKARLLGCPIARKQLYRVTSTIVVNLVKGKPRDAGPKLTAISVWH
jgi:hypothetical protein